MRPSDFSTIVAELQDIYMEQYHIDPQYMPQLHRRYGVTREMATTYDDAHVVLQYGADVEQRNYRRQY